MIYLFEQYGYDRTGFYEDLSEEQREKLSHIKESGFIKRVPRKKTKEPCLSIDFDKEKELFHFQTSYFVGVDWVLENQLSVYVQPKQNKDLTEINYMQMLLEALQESENLKHLEDLVHVDFYRPYISIAQKQDLLSPFLVAQFLQLVKRIVQKGLKKSYYTEKQNLNARVKGKILIGKNIKDNLVKGKLTHTVCQYQVFGVNCEENKILKKAYQFSRRVIQQYKNSFNTLPLLQLINYIHPAFENVSDDIDISKMKVFKCSPLFKEYEQAIKLAELILKRYSFNITKTEHQQIKTPPFWIDMSKLFELYVFKKLRDVFPQKDEVIYHYTAQSKELDFLINSPLKGVKMVVDTKYKPRYYRNSVDLDDYRQISGYARLKSVYDKLKIYDESNIVQLAIDCLIIYPEQKNSSEKIELNKKVDLDSYVQFYKLGVKLPEF
jgi:5-methylcytosine-specific restriction enzyme subunit McrC